MLAYFQRLFFLTKLNAKMSFSFIKRGLITVCLILLVSQNVLPILVQARENERFQRILTQFSQNGPANNQNKSQLNQASQGANSVTSMVGLDESQSLNQQVSTPAKSCQNPDLNWREAVDKREIYVPHPIY
jgi:hypothetical protein